MPNEHAASIRGLSVRKVFVVIKIETKFEDKIYYNPQCGCMRGVRQNENIMKIKLYTSIFSVICLVSLTDCNKKCKNQFQGNLSFTVDELKIVPYSNQTNLIFINTLNDTINITTTTSSTKQDEITELADYRNSDCLKYYHCQNFGFVLKDSLNAFEINIALQYALYPPEKALYIKVELPVKDSISHFSNFIYLKNDSIQGPYYPTLTLGSRTFSYVHEFLTMDINPVSDYLEFVYYTVKQGIVGFKSHNGKTWYLAN
jgi:hypothetical protein